MINQQSQNLTQKQSQHGIERSAELDELNFADDEPTPSFGELEPDGDRDQLLTETSDVGLTGAATPGREPTNDDMSPETLIQEDGARSPHEPGGNTPIDRELSTVSENEIGGGSGLDEAELARAKPLDGKKWDGNPDEPLSSAPSFDEVSATEYDEDLDLDEEE